MLTKLCKSCFQIIIEVSLWMLLIGFIAGGWYFGGELDGKLEIAHGIGLKIGCAIVGLLAFAITVIPVYGLIAIFINMDKNIELLKDNAH